RPGPEAVPAPAQGPPPRGSSRPGRLTGLTGPAPGSVPGPTPGVGLRVQSACSATRKDPSPLMTRRDAQGGRRPGGPAASAVGAEPPQNEALQRGPGEAPGGRSDQQRIDDPTRRADA